MAKAQSVTLGIGSKRISQGIEVSEALDTRIVRGGKVLPEARVDREVLGSWLERQPPVTGTATPRVVGQSIAPGAVVPRGTVVDLVLAPPSIVPWDIFEGVHPGFKGKMLSDLAVLYQDKEVQAALTENESAGQLTATARENLEAKLKERGIVTSTAPEASFEAAFDTLRSGLAFF